MRNGYSRGIRRHRDPLGAADFDPAIFQARKFDERAQRRLIDARGRRHPAHMIDDEWQRELSHHPRERDDVRSIDVQDDVPPPPLDAIDNAIERGHIGRATEMFHEIEAYSAHAAAIERVEILVRETVVDNGNATIAPGIGGDAIEHRSIISAVTTRLHDYGAFNAEVRVQGRQHFLWRV